MALKQAFFAGFGPFTYDDSVSQYGVVVDKASVGDVTLSGASQTTENFSIVADNKALILGAGSDASVLYDGTDLVVNPKVVGSGKLKVAGDINIIGNLLINSIQVLTDQQAAVANPTGGSTVDTECRAALVSLLGALRTHGIIDT